MCIYFQELKKVIFCEYLFSRMASFWKCQVYKFKPQRKKNKKNTVESRDIQLMFLSRSIERWKNCCYWLILKKAGLTSIFCAYFFCIYFCKIWILCIFGVYLLSQMLFKRKFHVYLILRNQPKYVQFAKTCTHES